MKPVLVKFAGVPDPVARRRAVQLGQNLPAGQRKVQVFGGFLISVVGQPARSIATCIELGVDAVVLFGNFLLNDMFNSYSARVRLPSYARLTLGGEALPPSVAPTVPPATPGDVGKSRVPVVSGPRAYVAGYWDPNQERVYPGSPATSWGCWPVLESFFWGAAHLTEDGVVHGVCAPMPYGGTPVAQMFPDTAWMGQARFVWSQVHLRYLSLSNPRGVSFTDGWLTGLLGKDHYFSGRGITSNYYYTPETSFEYETSWRVIGPTPTPRFYTDPDDGEIGYNYYPHQMTRDNAGAMVQLCYPLAYPTDDGGMLVAATCIAVETSDYLLYLERTGEQANEGYVSTHSLIANWGATAPCFSPGAGEPKLALLKFGAAPMTAAERQSSLGPTLPHDADMRMGYSSNGVAAHNRQSEASLPPIDKAIPEFSKVATVSVYDLPEWAHPMGLTEWRDIYVAALESSNTEQDPVRITSDNRMSVAFGTVRQTVVDDVVEYVFAVRSRAGSAVPINRARRAAPDEILPGEQAAVMVTKTGLAVVRATLEGTVLSTDLWYPDVVGPGDCSQFDPLTMDAEVAKVPQVKFSAVMGGKRVYVCRVVRYARTPFLASVMGAEGTMMRFERYTSNYQGRKNSGVGGPTFLTDKAFGPYPDQTQYEETWVIVDGVRHILNPVALGGSLEPFTDRKFPHGFSLRFTGNPVLTHPYFVHMYGMWSEQDEQDRVLMDYMAEEFAPSAYELETVVAISDTALMVLLCPLLYSGTVPLEYVLCRHDILTGETTEVYRGVGAWPPDRTPPRTLDWAPALTCYQREVVNDDGEVVIPAHLILRVGYQATGAVSTSLDGGVTWELLYTDAATRQLSTNGTVINANGTPGLGLHILGRVGAGSKFQFIIGGGR